MTAKVLFLSHIHEERDLALAIKTELENEFSGFVDVFVSSDGVSIPAGANFLKRIEDGLITCVGALYLISPVSVKRSWISFELGAVWIRNIVNLRANGPEIPTLPVCHSGLAPAGLPSPLNNLNGISANQASQLEFAFRSLQAAVGGRGNLKTDFDALAGRVIAFERSYTLGANLKRMFSVGGDVPKLIKHCEQQPGVQTVVDFGFVETPTVQLFQQLEANELKGHVKVAVTNPGISFGPQGGVNGANVQVTVGTSLIVQFKSQLLAP